MTASASAIDHFSKLQVLLADLSDLGIFLSEHEYSYSSFGSFVVVLSAGHSQTRFLWDGKDSILTVETRSFQNQNATEPWVHDAYISVRGADVFAEIGSNAEQILT